jgi:hypothetical protein
MYRGRGRGRGGRGRGRGRGGYRRRVSRHVWLIKVKCKLANIN